MSESKTWPSGTTNQIPTVYNIPDIQDLNWAGAVTDFLVALADGAQSTTFQRWAFQVVTSTPYVVSDSDCVMVVAPSPAAATTITLPDVTYKRVLIVTDGNNDAGTNNITITPQPTESINGGGLGTPIALTVNYQSVILIGDSDNNTWRTCLWASP